MPSRPGLLDAVDRPDTLEGSLRAEVANVTDEQEVIAVNVATGQVVQARSSYQNPREVRR